MTFSPSMGLSFWCACLHISFCSHLTSYVLCCFSAWRIKNHSSMGAMGKDRTTKDRERTARTVHRTAAPSTGQDRAMSAIRPSINSNSHAHQFNQFQWSRPPSIQSIAMVTPTFHLIADHSFVNQQTIPRHAQLLFSQLTVFHLTQELLRLDANDFLSNQTTLFS